MIKCEECISFVICIQSVTIVANKRQSYGVSLDTNRLDTCLHFRNRFYSREITDYMEREKVKRFFLEAKDFI